MGLDVTVAAGQSTTVTVAAGDFIRLTTGPAGNARLESVTAFPAGRVWAASHSGRQAYGPFEGAGTVRVTAGSDALTYNVLTPGEEVDDDEDRNAVWSDSTGAALVPPDNGRQVLEPLRLSFLPNLALPPVDATGITITPGPTVAADFATERTTLNAALPKLYNFIEGANVVTNANRYLLAPGSVFRNAQNLGVSASGEARNDAGTQSFWLSGWFEFMTDAQDLCVLRVGADVGRLSLYVDGVLASADTVSTVAPLGGGNRPMWHRIQFTTRRVRRLSMQYNNLAEIRCALSSDSIWRPAELPRIHMVGDSFAANFVGPTESGIAHQLSGESTLRLVHRVQRVLGFQGPATYSTRGSTGFAQFSGGDYNYVDRMNFEPGSSAVRILHLFGTGNDSVFTSAQRRADVAAAIEIGRTKFPNAMIVVSSPVEGFSGTAIVNPIADDIQAVCAQFPSSLVKYLPIHSAGRVDEGYIYGTGRVGATAGNGNADLYLGSGTADRHWNSAGITYAAIRFAQDLRALAEGRPI